MLTRKQHDLLAFIDRFTRENGWAPSFQDMMLAIGAKSKGYIFVKLAALEERGFIRRPRYRARAIEVLKLPEQLQPPDDTLVLVVTPEMTDSSIIARVIEWRRARMGAPVAQTLPAQCRDNALTMPGALE